MGFVGFLIFNHPFSVLIPGVRVFLSLKSLIVLGLLIIVKGFILAFESSYL
jgi:hypothetical protein